MSYLLRDDNIIWDAISPQDVIIADLKKGCYTTLSGLGAEFLWQRLITPYSANNLFSDCRKYFKEFSEHDENKIQQIIANLLEQDILIKMDQSTQQDDPLFSNPTAQLEAFNVEHTQYADIHTLLQLDSSDNSVDV